MLVGLDGALVLKWRLKESLLPDLKSLACHGQVSGQSECEGESQKKSEK